MIVLNVEVNLRRILRIKCVRMESGLYRASLLLRDGTEVVRTVPHDYSKHSGHLFAKVFETFDDVLQADWESVARTM